jgi:hypothetical protein
LIAAAVADDGEPEAPEHEHRQESQRHSPHKVPDRPRVS